MRRTAVFCVLLCVGCALLAPPGRSSASGSRGGTLRVNQSGDDFDFVDPQLAYRSDDWGMLYATSDTLLGLPEKRGAAGGQIYPVGAAAFPTISRDGRTYTFHLRTGMRFSDGTRVTAAAYRRAFERVLSPKMGSPVGVNIGLQSILAGGAAFLAGKAPHISGIHARGLTLTFHLTRPTATFSSMLTMQWFTAVEPSLPYAATGVSTFAAAGPYYVSARDPGRATLLARNPYYHGPRPANPDTIVFTPNVDVDQSLLQVKAGQADLDINGIPPTAAADLASRYGVNRHRFFVGSTSCVNFMTMNVARPPFDDVRLRKAVEYAIDRPAQVRLLGAFAGKRTDQMLVPGIPGYRPLDVYPLNGADPQKAKAVGGAALAAAPTLQVVHVEDAYATQRAELAEYELREAGFTVTDVPTPATSFFQVVGTKGTAYNLTTDGGWCADYFDPYDYLNTLFDGRNIQATNNVDYSYFANPSFERALDHAASLTGVARANAYARLDARLMVDYAPVVPYLVSTNRFFVSARVRNWVYNPYFGLPCLNAISVEDG